MVTVTQLPSSGITGPLEICAEEYAVFNASPAVTGATYAWTFDGGTSLDGDANDVTESIKWATSYYGTTRTVTLVVTKDNCSSTYTKAINIKQPASLNTPDTYQVCQGGTVQIGPNPNDPNQVTPGSTFQWTPNLFLNNNSMAQPLSTPPFDIVYTLTDTVNGCAVSKQITVDVNVALNPIADAGLDKSICITESAQLGGSPTATPPPAGGATISGILWTIPPSTSITSTQSNPLVSPTTNTQYRVVVVASNGCADTDFVNVAVTPKSKIGDYTWIDTDGYGCQDAGETGINGFGVRCKKPANTAQYERVLSRGFIEGAKSNGYQARQRSHIGNRFLDPAQNQRQARQNFGYPHHRKIGHRELTIQALPLHRNATDAVKLHTPTCHLTDRT